MSASATGDGEGETVSEVWEPWKPAIGQRVRIRLSAECVTHQAGTSPELLALTAVATGVVVEWPEWAYREVGVLVPDHPYCVLLDEWIGDMGHLAICAAAELIPTDPAP